MSDRSLDAFLLDLTKTANADTQFLARTWLGFGGKRAFGHLELRSYYREDGLSGAGFKVLEEAYAPRSMALSEQVQPYGSNDPLVHMPELYRVQVRPRTYSSREARKLHIWHPGHALWVEIQEDDTPQDVLAAPVTPGAKTSKDETNVAIPPLRIAEGAVDLRLDLKDNSLFQTHMDMNLAQAVVFGMFGFHLIGGRHWPVRITAQGIEFDATLPDPTRGYAGMGVMGDRIAVRLRLETLPYRKDLACPYVLRLIGPSLELDPDSSVVHLAQLRDRLSQAAGSLVQDGNPARLRLNTLGAIPPVFWPLQFRFAAGHNRLHFVSVPDNTSEAVLQIDPAALDLRLATRSTHPEADTGLARVHLDEAVWMKEKTGFRLAVRAGHAPGAMVTKPAATQTYALTYSRTDTVWSGSLTGQITDERVHLPLGLLVDRLTPLYRAAHAIAATETAPYAFLAVQDGWLQMPLDKAATQLGVADPMEGGPQAMTGRIVFFPDADGTEAATGLSIDDARRMGVDIHWQGEDPLAAQVDVIPEEPTGQFLGFLYAADTSPDARNAVPVWSAGDAATREVPLWFGLSAGVEQTATLTWSREAGTRWSLDFGAGSRLSEADDTGPSWLAWLSPGPHPFVTNYAMARTAQGVRAPSATRGMVPYQVEGRAVMTFSAAATSDGTGNTLPRLTGLDGKVLPGPPVLDEKQPEDHAPLARSLLLPTLNGTESPVPSDTEMRDWTHRMRLRYDLPVLDELFAWSDPPPEGPESSPAVIPDATKVRDPLPTPPVVTALKPDRLAEVWHANEHRMRLTWTEDAVVSNALLGTDGTAQSVKFDKIAAPYPFHTGVAITLSPAHLLGHMEFPDLPGQPEGLEGALVGLGGRLRQDQKPLSLVVKKGELHPAAMGEAATVTVTGYAADHYVDPDLPALMTDNRGSAVDPDGAAGLRAIAKRATTGKKPEVRHLLTLARDEIVTTKQIEFGFAARDLPVTRGPDGVGYVFHGVSVEGQPGGSANPVEGSRGFDGQSFDAESLLDGIYEWRCYGFPGSAKKAEKDVPAGYFEIAADPFAFRPLRLVRAEFDDERTPTKVQILGSLTLGAADREPGLDFAFGPDRVYDRDDLFLLTAVKDGKTWTTSLIAYNLDPGVTDTLHLLPLQAGEAPAVRFSRRVGCATNSFFKYDGELPVSITLTFDPEATWPEIATAKLRGHLFGAEFGLTGTATVGADGTLTLSFIVVAPDATDAAFRLEDLSVEVQLTAHGVGDTMAMSGSVVGAAQSGAAEGLFRHAPDGLTWMDLSLPQASATQVDIDHAEGAIALNLEPLDVDKATSPLFGLVFPDTAKPRLTGSLTAVLIPGTTAVATAVMYVELRDEAGKDHLIRHELSHGPDYADRHNHLDITWTQKPNHPCPIRWPVGQDEVALKPGAGQQTLDEIGTGPLKPKATKRGEPHRLLRLKPGGETLRHEVVLKLRAHRIPVGDLKRGDAAVLPVRTLRTMAVTEHRLTSDQTGTSVAWQGLDHVAITSAAAMRAEAGELAFAPRMSARVNSKGNRLRLWYRGIGLTHTETPEGQAPIGEANLSGFHDAGMIEHLWQDDLVPGPVILGGGVLRLPLDEKKKEARAHILNLPWVMGLPEETALQSLSDDREWRIATVDAWAAHAVAVTGAGTLQTFNDRMDEAGIRRHLGVTSAPSRDPIGDPTRLIPADAGLFERWTEADKEGDVDAGLHVQAPYFLRAALALRARWRALLEGHDQWTAQSLVPQPWDISGGAAVARSDGAALLQVIDVRTNRHLPSSDSDAVMVTADIVALSRRGVTLARGYRALRSTHATDTGGVLAEMRQIADTLDHRARAALRQVGLPGGHRETLARILGRADDPLAATAEPLVRQVADIGASPALGWPRPADEIAAALVPTFGPDRAVQAPQAGFSGRAQRVAWPARAIADPAQADGIYASFGQHVVFDRGDAPFAHDGPAGRHLAPVLPRRRGPVPVHGAGALSPPRLDRLTIGRRPGAMEVSTTSLTLTRDTPGIRHLLDASWPGMGRAADTAPVLTHGLRTPRSTVLPPDPSPASLDVRRRTFLSRADTAFGFSGKPELILFGDFAGVQDVIRLYHDSTGTDWRVLAGGQGASGLRTGPDWQGTLRVRLSGQAVASPEKPGAPANPTDILGIADPTRSLSLIADLAIGGQVTTQTAYTIRDDGDAVILSVTFPDIDALQTRLAAATADTPMSLTLKFPRAADGEPADDALAPAPGVAIELPLTLDPGNRRVVPTRSRTIAFGDPAYDRVLASLTATLSARVGDVEWRVAADRREYNRDSTIMLAFGPIDPIADTFETNDQTIGTLRFERIPLSAPETTEDLAIVLPGAPTASKKVTLKAGNPVRFRLTDLRGTGPDPHAPLASGDTLLLRLVAGDFKQILRVRIVAAPVIAPPASVYSVIESAPTYARTRLHAPGSLPTRIEFRHLTEDLARGHVRREALFVWHYSVPAGDEPNTLTTDLIKLDRSGGAQLPKDH